MNVGRVDRPYLSVVIPAFNEEPRIGATLESVVTYLGGQSYDWDVTVVDDGSTDGTADLVGVLAREEPRVRLERVPHAGKGWAVRQGMLATTGLYRFMCDADLSMPIENLRRFLDAMEAGKSVAIGSRETEGSRRVGETALRHLRGRVFNWLVRVAAVRGVQDTQCGFKCFRGNVADEIFSMQRTRGFGFDVELLFLSRKKGHDVHEIPIEWRHNEASKVRPVVDSVLMAWDTLMVRLRDTAGVYGSSR